MTIEAKLDTTNELLQAILTVLQSGAAVAPAAPAEDKPKRGRKPAADAAPAEDKPVATPVVDGDPEGTRYWVSEDAKQVFAQTPGLPDPKDDSFKIESAEQYLAKKAEFAAGNAQVAATPATETAATPAQTTPAASTASSASGEVSWKDDVFPAIRALNTAKGSEAIRTLIEHFGLAAKTADNPNGATVPSLEKLNKHAEVKAAAEKLTRGEPLAAETDDLLG